MGLGAVGGIKKTIYDVPSMLRTRCRIESLDASYGCSFEGISSTAGTGAENLASTGRISLAICQRGGAWGGVRGGARGDHHSRRVQRQRPVAAGGGRE